MIVPGLERSTQADHPTLLHWIEQTRLVGPAEQEEHEFVVAPIGRNGQPGDIYRWITKQHGRREHDEAKRVLYVAATRASEELHLLATATVKMPKNGVQELTPGDKHSLLGIAWEALRDDFRRRMRAEVATTAAAQQTEFDFAAPSKTIALRRLPVDWKSPQPGPVPTVPENSLEIVSGPAARSPPAPSAP